MMKLCTSVLLLENFPFASFQFLLVKPNISFYSKSWTLKGKGRFPATPSDHNRVAEIISNDFVNELICSVWSDTQ
jgi:hypothetical protein